ncbi:translocation and assembly module lipoprotein TamL [Mesonia aestuariivivens]|uniref:Outer membrane protein assembly factor n=1 Tax=Mesonia aestuariivivens TaxID=2796128 RepID=A0ABS6W4S3_9FLAO|nr:BamA/TamA family outer membrane protein [Mesonia aestuariivivens]MBW2962835.1 outer membrane protein assembly factor [Mesonia aestuariivivens]
MKSILKKYPVCVMFVLLFLGYSCSVKKYIPEGEYLYRGGHINYIDTVLKKKYSEVKAETKGVLYPKPNSKFLGIYPGLYVHYKAQRENPGIINKFLNKKIGEEPVYFSDANLSETEELINNRLENRGFFYTVINSNSIIDSTSKTAKAEYLVTLREPYVMETYQLEKDSLKNIDSIMLVKNLEKVMFDENSILKKGMRFDLENFKSERERIDDYLKHEGFYNFNANFLIFEADTNTYDQRKYDLFLKMKEEIPNRSKVPYLIDKIEVYPNETIANKEVKKDTITLDSLNFVQSETFFKPKRLSPYILLKPGQRYNPLLSKYTSRRLSSIGTYKFVNIRYEEKDSIIDENGFMHLDAIIELSPLRKRSLRAELQGVTKSNNFTGPGLGLTYTNRNWFKGGEQLNIRGSVGYEKQFSSGEQSGLSSLQLGLETSVRFPRLLFPILNINKSKRFKYSIPQTEVKLGIDYLNRSELYSLNSYQASFGYIWKANRFITHQLNPLNINYVKLGNVTDRFDEILEDNPFLKQSFEQQFIAGLTYSFTYSELGVTQNNGALYVNFNFDIAGNALSLFDKKGTNDDGDEVNKFLGLQYAQYAKGGLDIRYHYKLDDDGQVLVARLYGGLGYAYGNSESLPFIKQYFSGGPYSVRAFRIRGLGPGSYQPTDENSYNAYFDRAGDIRLEANLEYRFPLFNYVNGAIFTDAGNVWLLNQNDALPGGKFTSSFINELGIGSGVGVRVDIQGFVIRLDLASPIKRPAKTWKFEYDSPVLNFAIGYPF